MGTISILLGIITFFLFTGAGAILSNMAISYSVFDQPLTEFLHIPPTTLMVGVIALFAFIGLLIGMNLIMLGINHNKLSKIQRQLKRRHG